MAIGRAELVAAARDGKLEPFLKQARKGLGEAGWPAFVEEVVTAHREGEIDLAAAFSVKGPDRPGFAVQRLLEDALPRLDIDLAAVLAVVNAVSARVGDGRPPHYVLKAFGGWCERDSSRPGAAFEKIRIGEAPADLLRVTLGSGLRVDRSNFLPLIVDMLSQGSPDEQAAAADVLGAFQGFEATEQDLVVSALDDAVERAEGLAIEPRLRAVLAIALRQPELNEIGRRALRKLEGRSDAHVRQAVAGEVMFHTAKADDALVAAAFDLLSQTEGGETATLDYIDQIIVDNLAGRHTEPAAQLMDTLLATGAASLTVLDSVRHALATGDGSVRSALVARWLRSGETGHLLAVRDICTGMEAPVFDLDFSGSGLSKRQAVRIAKLSCAVLMVAPNTVASILLSLLRTGPADAAEAIEELLFDPLLVTYWTGARDYLESALTDAPQSVGDAVRRALARKASYAAAVKAAGDLAELQPSEHHRFVARTRREEEQREIAKDAQSKSIFASIFPTSVLLYGDSAIFDVHIEPGKTHRQETPLQSYEFSQELPGLDIIDPFGAWYRREMLLSDEADS